MHGWWYLLLCRLCTATGVPSTASPGRSVHSVLARGQMIFTVPLLLHTVSPISRHAAGHPGTRLEIACTCLLSWARHRAHRPCSPAPSSPLLPSCSAAHSGMCNGFRVTAGSCTCIATGQGTTGICVRRAMVRSGPWGREAWMQCSKHGRVQCRFKKYWAHGQGAGRVPC